MKNIIKKNFDLNAVPIENTPGEFPRQKMGVYGRGIYFSEHPGYSLQYGNALILCKVLLGNVLTLNKRSVGSGDDIAAEFDSKKINSDSLDGLIYVVKQSCQILPFSIIAFNNKQIRGKIRTGKIIKATPTVKLSPQLEQILKTYPSDGFLKDIILSSQLNEQEKTFLIKSHLKIQQ